MTDIVEEMARAIWTAPITGQPSGEEVRPWPPRNSDAMIETMNQARAAHTIVERRIGEMEEALEVARHELRRQHDGVDFDRAKRIRAMMPQIDAALQSKQSVEQRSDQ
jgi:hypothetical protein